MGHIARSGRIDRREFQQAMVMGCVLGSFTVEEFSVDRLVRVRTREIMERFFRFRALTAFEDLDADLIP